MFASTATGVPSPLALFLVSIVLLNQISLAIPQRQKSKEEEQYEKRPYKFQFNIEDHHHRKEEKNDKGIIMGEFGFVTADFFYLTTVYATDEEGKFHILSRSRKYIGPPTEKPPTRSAAVIPNRPTPSTSRPITPPRPQAAPQSTTKKPNGRFNGLIGCSNCIVPTTTTRPSFPGSGGADNGRSSFPGSGNIPTRGQNVGSAFPPLGQRAPLTPGLRDPGTSFGPGQGALRRPGQSPSGRPGLGAVGSIGQAGPNRPGSIDKTVPFSGGNPATNKFPGTRPGERGQNSIAGRDGVGNLGLVAGEKGGPHYKFNYTAGFHGHHETGYKGGSKEGGYFANHRDGEGQRVVYEANEFGYQPNVTKVRLSDEETPKLETEKDYGLKGYEFKWFN